MWPLWIPHTMKVLKPITVGFVFDNHDTVVDKWLAKLTCWHNTYWVTNRRGFTAAATILYQLLWIKTSESETPTPSLDTFSTISTKVITSNRLARWLVAAEDLQRSRLQMLFFQSTAGRPTSAPSPPSKTETWTSPKADLLVPASQGLAMTIPYADVYSLPVQFLFFFQRGRRRKGTRAVIWSVIQSRPSAPPLAKWGTTSTQYYNCCLFIRRFYWQTNITVYYMSLFSLLFKEYITQI